MANKFIITLILALLIANTFILFVVFQKEPTITGQTIVEPSIVQEIQSDFPESAYVSKIIDGDTVIIAGESVRLLGMDTDERGKPCYKEAKDRIEELILDKEVKLETDAEDKDQYDRYLRYIILNGKNINLQMVEEGLAVARFVKGVKYKEEIIAAEREARNAKIGCKWRDEKEDEEEIQPITTSIPAPPLIQETIPTSPPEDLGYDCSSNKYNCPDFSSHAEAQAVYESCGGVGNDIHRLDGDSDGLACEVLS